MVRYVMVRCVMVKCVMVRCNSLSSLEEIRMSLQGQTCLSDQAVSAGAEQAGGKEEEEEEEK